MFFQQRLGFLMDLTSTSNISLARALMYDASYVSRIRNGKRPVPNKQVFAVPAAEYFVSKIVDDAQREALESAIGNGVTWPQEPREQAALLAAWLMGAPATIDERIGNIINSFSKVVAAPPAELDDEALPQQRFVSEDSGHRADAECYYGDVGKQSAVLKFLRGLEGEQGVELLLFSDENTGWLFGNAAFVGEWARALSSLMKAGLKIKIVHTVTRDAAEMLEAIQNWLPLYLTGMIESYYYPKMRDGLLSRSLFVARGHSVLMSSSVGGVSEGMANILSADADLVASGELEFDRMLGMCKPLVRVEHMDAFSRLPVFAAELAEVSGRICVAGNIDESASNEGTGVSNQAFFDLVTGSCPSNATVDCAQCGLIPLNTAVLAGEQAGFSLVHTSMPPLVMTVREQRLAKAFYEYLRRNCC